MKGSTRMEQVKLYDTTLRDGMGTPGLSLSVDEKLRVVDALDALGVHMIEAGFPSSNPKESEFFDRLAETELDQATICAFGMTRRRDLQAEEDPALQTLSECFAPVVTLVGKSWSLHLAKVTKVSHEENLAMIADSVAFCREKGKRVVYDAEHFFDGYRDDRSYALECLRAAVAAGAENVTLCDTNGGSLPELVEAATAAVVADLGQRVEVGIHTHDDAGCAVANSLIAVRAGARMVQGTINGYGERCGNADLASILPSLQLKMGFDVVRPKQLADLARTAHYLDELCNMTPDPAHAYIGWNAFVHKAGMHSAGVEADPRTFEHIDPVLVGNQSGSTPSELAGKGTIRSQAKRLGIELDAPATELAVEQLKAREHLGYHYEAAPASFELLLRRAAGHDLELFELESYSARTLKPSNRQEAETEAAVRAVIDGERHVCLALGNGPVNALDQALRQLLGRQHPGLLDDVELVNFKVRILDEAHGTDAITRVLLETTDGEHEWATIGVSENVIEASWLALVDSLEYAFHLAGEKGRVAVGGRRS
jgi:2-isopropylmalate synthase